jgi:hypothetical protein
VGGLLHRVHRARCARIHDTLEDQPGKKTFTYILLSFSILYILSRL